MQDKLVLVPISLEDLEALIERAAEKSIQKVLNIDKEKPDETLLSTQQVCEEFRVSRITLNNYRKSGKLIPHSKAGKQHAYRRCDCRKAFYHKMNIGNINHIKE